MSQPDKVETSLPGEPLRSPAIAAETPVAPETPVASAAAPVAPEDDARGRLLAAAGPVFARSGYERATLREICGDAGMNIASVGYYFGDKFGLYQEVFRAIRQHCQQDAPLPAPAAGLPPREQLYQLVRHVLARMLARDDSGWECQLMMREMQQPTGVFAEMVEESVQPLFERMVGIIAALAPADTAAHRLEQLALSVLGQILHYRVAAGVIRQLIPAQRLAEHFDQESLAQQITGVAIAAAEGGLAAEHADRLGATAVDSSPPDL